MWFARGVQSAIFYYVTCTPCAEAKDRRRRKKDAIRTQREQAKSAAVITDQPRPFAQPAPFSTNKGWTEEIALGPGPPARRHRLKNNNLSSDAPRLSSTSSMTVEESILEGGKGKTSLGEKLHWSRFQREDELLWGEEEREANGSVPGSSVGISGRGRADTSYSNKYTIARAPPVNDLHPPIVSGPTSRSGIRWMLQPPPSAKVMAGKAREDYLRHHKQPRKSRVDSKIDDFEEEELIQEGQSTAMTDRASWLLGKANTYRRALDWEKKQRPSVLDMDSVAMAYSPQLERGRKRHDETSEAIRPPSSAVTTTTTRSTSMVNGRHAYDQWHLQLSPSFHSRSNSPSSMGSPADSLHWPDTPPLSRAVSTQRKEENGKVYQPSYLNLEVPVHRENKSIEAIQFEVNEPRSKEHMHPPKWRWSFDM